MNIVFRADSSINIGSGHIMRCLTLASYLAEKGHQCYFVCRMLGGNLIDMIIQKGFPAYALQEDKEPMINEQRLFHSHWLGVSQQTDIQETIAVLKNNEITPDWLIIDHYALDEEWEKLFSSVFKNTKIFVIDDLADRNHQCDLLLDQNLDASSMKYVSRVIPTRTQVLAGVKFALLRPEFAIWRGKSLAYRKAPKLKEILLNLGGIDKDNITEQVLQILSKTELAESLHITVVMGKTAPHINKIKELSRALSLNIDVVVNVSNMAELMAKSDLAIGAAGSTSWERCCLGLPTLLFVLAENQKKVANILEYNGIAKIVDVDNIAKVLQNLTACDLQKMSEKASSLIDGKGALRVIRKIENIYG